MKKNTRLRMMSLLKKPTDKLNADKAKAKVDKNVRVFSLDVQKTKPLPHLNTNECYYKRPLALYNRGIHKCGTELDYFHM